MAKKQNLVSVSKDGSFFHIALYWMPLRWMDMLPNSSFQNCIQLTSQMRCV